MIGRWKEKKGERWDRLRKVDRPRVTYRERKNIERVRQ